jgi:crotonobetainyl-CoA:carnitine CoA-transferase CaiB-like acyl-CoA transferase
VGVPCGPVNTLSQVFEDPQVKHREMVVAMPHAKAADGVVNVLANPIRFSETPIQYRITPPMRNEHAQEILRDWLGETG